ncbi:MAG: hypothetical protein JWO86_9107 [Myxococcaceae bacterium]|nr:hypothetical protein [Myxococcaceae bacterium]
MISRLARHLPLRLAFFTVLAAVLVWPVLVDAARLNEFRDVHHLFLYERSAIDTIKRYGELPLWNPYYCGGFDAVAAPQTRFMSPTILLGLLFGAERAEILTVFFFTVLGMEGTYRWLRLRTTEPLAALVVAPIFALSGQYAVSYNRGWIQFMGFHLVPWILYGITLAARRKWQGIAVSSIAFAWMLGFAGFFAAPLVAVAAVLESVRTLAEQPRGARWRSFAMLLATASFMAMVACVRLWPVAETLLSAPRVMAGTPGHAPRALLSALVGVLAIKDGNTEMVGSFYVGAAFLALVALGSHHRSALGGLVIAMICGWLASGYATRISAFGLLREVPTFAAIRYPERFLWLGILFASGSVVGALSRVPFIGETRRWRVGTAIVLVGAVLFTIGSEIAAFHRVATNRTLGTVTTDRIAEFHQARGNRWLAVHLESQNIGSLGCYETHRLAESTLLRGDLPQEEYLAPDAADAGTVKRVSWSPNKIVVHADVSRPARLLVNQNWAPGWHASVGKVVSHEGLLAVDLPAGVNDVAITFLPWSTLGGAATTITALLALALIGWRARRRGEIFARRQWMVTVLLVLLPWGVAAAAHSASPDDKWPPPAMKNANGTPALVADDEKIDAMPVGATYALPLRVEMGKVTPPDEHHNLLIEVYFRRLDHIPRAMTMFVHLERRKDLPPVPKDKEDFYNADHQVVGGSFYLSDAPEGRLVHDAFGAHVEKAGSGTWDVWVAFGDVSGQKGRSRVVEPGKATVSSDRVRVGTFVIP